MGTRYPAMLDLHREFLEAQRLFFVATAAADGRVNVSPKGLDSLRVLDERTVVWLSVTGSGNETAAHLLENPRMTLMACAFEGPPTILRLYGRARVAYPGDDDWEAHAPRFPDLPGARQLYVLDVDLVQTSCGMAVPYFDYAGDRDDLVRWAERKGEARLVAYREEKNRTSIDGRDTGLP